MFDYSTKTSDGHLAASARRDGQRLTPAFSELLHRRVVGALEKVEGSRLVHRATAPVSPRSYWIGPLALAAVVAIVAVPTAMLFRTGQDRVVQAPVRQSDKIAERLPAAPKPQLAVYATAHEMNSTVQNVVKTAVAREQFVGLDHDVRSATAYLVDQVPLRTVWEAPEPAGER